MLRPLNVTVDTSSMTTIYRMPSVESQCWWARFVNTFGRPWDRDFRLNCVATCKAIQNLLTVRKHLCKPSPSLYRLTLWAFIDKCRVECKVNSNLRCFEIPNISLSVVNFRNPPRHGEDFCSRVDCICISRSFGSRIGASQQHIDCEWELLEANSWWLLWSSQIHVDTPRNNLQDQQPTSRPRLDCWKGCRMFWSFVDPTPPEADSHRFYWRLNSSTAFS